MRQDEYNQGMERAMQRMHDDHMELRARLHRLRIAHLRRMSDAAFLLCAREEKLARTSWEEKWKAVHTRKAERFIRFCRACRAEITRLRGEG